MPTAIWRLLLGSGIVPTAIWHLWLHEVRSCPLHAISHFLLGPLLGKLSGLDPGSFLKIGFGFASKAAEIIEIGKLEECLAGKAAEPAPSQQKQSCSGFDHAAPRRCRGRDGRDRERFRRCRTGGRISRERVVHRTFLAWKRDQCMWGVGQKAISGCLHKRSCLEGRTLPLRPLRSRTCH